MPVRRTSPQEKALALVIATIVAASLAVPAFAQDIPPRLDDEMLVILEVRVDNMILSEGVIGYQSPAGPLLPLGTLCDLLEFAVEVEPSRRRADGWFGDESRIFRLNASTGVATSNGVDSSFRQDQVVVGDDDIYVTAPAFSEWFPCNVEVRLGQLLVKITPTEILPVQKRLRREQMQKNKLSGGRRHDLYPLERAEYQRFTWPLLDLNLEYRGRSDDLQPLASVQSTNDMLGFGTNLYASHDGGERLVSVARLRAGRTSDESDMFGPLGASRFEIGDLYAPSTPLVLRGKLGRGFQIDNHPLRQPDRFDSTEIAGDGPPGWEVELYANSTLIEISETDAEGRYLFEEIPLLFGRNEFRAVLYGPQGQTREHVRTITVGGEMIPRGQITYRLFAVQDETFLLVGDDLLSPSVDQGSWTTHAEAGYGLGRSLSMVGALTRQPLEGVDHVYRTLTVQSVTSGLHLQTTYVNDVDGGWAGGFGAQGGLFGRSLSLTHDIFQGFTSDANDINQQRSRETRLRLGGQTRWRDRGLAYDFKLQSTGYAGPGIERQDLVALRGASSLGGTQINARLNYRHSLSAAGSYDQLTTDEILSGRLGPFLIRGSMHSLLMPDLALESLAASAAWSPEPNVRFSGRLLHNFVGSGVTTIGGSLTLLMDQYQLSFNTHGSSGQSPYYGVALTTSFTRVPETGRFHVQRQRMSAGYGATARVFLDRNANGLYDDQDDPLPDVRLTGSTGSSEVTTDHYGRAFLGGLPAHRDRDITLDLGSIGDPYLLPVVPGLRSNGHPGGHVVLDFPVTFAGDVEGTVYGETLAGRIPIRGVALQLTDLSGRLIAETVSEFDGYYLFQEVPPGWYEVHVVPVSLTRKNLRRPAPVAVSIRADGGVSAGNDFVLRRGNESAGGR